MTDTSVPRSAGELLARIDEFANSGTPIVQIRTREPLRAATIMRRHFAETETPYTEWSFATGTRTFQPNEVTSHIKKGTETDFSAALASILEQLRNPQSALNAKRNTIHYFAFLDPGPCITNNPYILDLIAQYTAILPSSNAAVLFITPDAPMDYLPSGTVLSTHLPTPDASELEGILRRLLDSVAAVDSGFPSGHSLDDADIQRISVLGLGMTVAEFEQHVSLAIASSASQGTTLTEDSIPISAEMVSAGVAMGKVEVVRSSEILELMDTVDIDSIGGMQRLKKWVGVRAACFTPEAAEAGVEPPKGCVLVGVPGTGKSLVSKAIASVLGVPLVRMDFGRVFSKYVGESEGRVRAALKMVEDMAPVVLFVDEIDKGMGGVAAGGDSGTSLRVLGTYLTWLQETKAMVFNVVTANRVAGLPPELLRRGRFDQIFSVGMPNYSERKEVLSIHLAKRGYDIEAFNAAAISALVTASESFVPSEIESAVKDAITTAFAEGEELTVAHLSSALSELIPMSKSHAEQIAAIVEWAANNAIPVGMPEVEPEPDSAPVPLSRRVRRAVKGQ